MRLGHQLAHVVQRAVLGGDSLVVGDVVTVVARARVGGHEPQPADTELAQVRQPGDEAAQVADPVAVGVLERADEDLVPHDLVPAQPTGRRLWAHGGGRRGEAEERAQQGGGRAQAHGKVLPTQASGLLAAWRTRISQWRCGPVEAGRADLADDVAALHDVADGDEDLRLVEVVAEHAVAVVDGRPAALDGVRAGHDHDAVVRGVDGRALGRGQVEPVVERHGAALRVAPGVAEAARRHAFDGLDERLGPQGVGPGVLPGRGDGLGLEVTALGGDDREHGGGDLELLDRDGQGLEHDLAPGRDHAPELVDDAHVDVQRRRVDGHDGRYRAAVLGRAVLRFQPAQGHGLTRHGEAHVCDGGARERVGGGARQSADPYPERVAGHRPLCHGEHRREGRHAYHEGVVRRLVPGAVNGDQVGHVMPAAAGTSNVVSCSTTWRVPPRTRGSV